MVKVDFVSIILVVQLVAVPGCRPVRSLVMGAEIGISDWALASKIESSILVDY